MPSFDVVSEVEQHELQNAVDQANREITNRFDFKGIDASFELNGTEEIAIKAPSDFQVKQMGDILKSKVIKRDLDIKSLDFGSIETSLHEARQMVKIKQGIDKEYAKKITKALKEAKLKIQSSIQGDQVRVTGKKRDDLQDAIALLKETDIDLPLQFTNFRD